LDNIQYCLEGRGGIYGAGLVGVKRGLSDVKYRVGGGFRAQGHQDPCAECAGKKPASSKQ
jgi:hypothetical protein